MSMELTSHTTDKIDSCIESLNRFDDYSEIAMCIGTLRLIKNTLSNYVTDGISKPEDWYKNADCHPIHVGSVPNVLFTICDELDEGGFVWEYYMVDSMAQLISEWCEYNCYEVLQE